MYRTCTTATVLQIMYCCKQCTAQEYASDQARFFADFSDAYVRLSELGVSWRA